MDLQKAYQIVFNDLCECPMFQGRHDAANDNPHFMHGIETVMEIIAQRGYDERFAERFSGVFAFNMERSRENV